MENKTYKLTQFAKGSGCGCKISPAVLESLLHQNRIASGEKILVGNSSNDDAAVYDLGNGSALIITADFFTPIVDDPFVFGQVAAANAISDVYAMGGKPITAIALMGWPVDTLPIELAAQVMEGARKKCAEAGIVISGGHTIDSPEPFFGLSVNGMGSIAHLKRNHTAQDGDVIMLSKPIGTGILASATKRGLIVPKHEALLIEQLTLLNSFGEVLGKEQGIHAMTDVTGYGLLGHLIEMSEGAQLSARISLGAIPCFTPAAEYARNGILPDATFRNWNAYSSKTFIAPDVDPLVSFALLPDPQTNGGLLVAVDPEHAEEIIRLGAYHQIRMTAIGTFIAKGEKVVLVHP